MCTLAHSTPLLSLSPLPPPKDSDSDSEAAMESDGSHSHPRQVSVSGLMADCFHSLLLSAGTG